MNYFWKEFYWDTVENRQPFILSQTPFIYRMIIDDSFILKRCVHVYTHTHMSTILFYVKTPAVGMWNTWAI